jgi:hypothetical protein
VYLVLLIVNVEVDFVGPQCIWQGFNGVHLFYTQLAVPFVIIALYTLRWALKNRYMKQKISLERAMDNVVMNKTSIRDGTIGPSDYRTVIIKRGLIAFSFMYQVLAYRAFSVFPCTEYPDGKYLTKLPEIKCGSHEHTEMMIVAVFFIIVIILAYPICMLSIVLKARAENKLTDPAFIQKYGTFYEQYTVECVWWEIVILGRKLCISMVLALIDLPMIQGALTLLLIYFAIWLQQSNTPYLERRHNLLETGCLFCAMVYVIGGMIFYPSLNSSPGCVGTEGMEDAACASTGAIKQGFSVALILMVILTVGLAIASALWEVYERRQSRLASEFITSKEVRNSIGIATQKESSRGQSIPLVDENLAAVQLHLSHMLDGIFLSAWKDWLVDMKEREENIELKYGIKSAASSVKEQLMIYAKLDKIIPTSACKFRSKLSPASNSNLAGMTMQLMTAFPGLIDFMFSASDSVRTGVFDFLESFLLFTAQNPRLQNQNRKSNCEEIIVAEYRPVVAHWLMTCDLKSVLRFRRFIKLFDSDSQDTGMDIALCSPDPRKYTNLRLKTGFRRFSTDTCGELRDNQQDGQEQFEQDANTDSAAEACILCIGAGADDPKNITSAAEDPLLKMHNEITGGAKLFTYDPSSESNVSADFVEAKFPPADKTSLLFDPSDYDNPAVTASFHAATPPEPAVLQNQASPYPAPLPAASLTGNDRVQRREVSSSDLHISNDSRRAVLTDKSPGFDGRSWEHCSPRRLQAVMAAGLSSPRRPGDVYRGSTPVLWEPTMATKLDQTLTLQQQAMETPGPLISSRPVQPVALQLSSVAVTNTEIDSSEFDRAWQSMNERLRSTWRAMSPR